MNTTTTKRIDWEAIKQRMPELQATLMRPSTLDATLMNEIRRERAARLANPPTEMLSATDALSVVVFKIGDESYAVELKHVTRVLFQPAVTPVPGASNVLLGIANMQGEPRSVLDLRRLLSLPEGPVDPRGYVLLLRRACGLVGLRVDQLCDVRHVGCSEFITPEIGADDRLHRSVRGVTPDKVMLLDLDALLETTQQTTPAVRPN